MYKAILKGWFNKERIGRIIIDIAIIILLSFMMFWCSRIPLKTIDIKLESYGPKNVDVNIAAVLASDTQQDYDETYYEFKNRGKLGAQMRIHCKGSIPNAGHFKEMKEQKDSLLKVFPESPIIDSLNGYFAMDYDMLAENSVVGGYVDVKDNQWQWGDSTKTRFTYFKGKLFDAEYEQHGLFHDTRLKGKLQVVYKDSVSCTVPLILQLPSKGWKGFNYNYALWQMCDVSQTYIGVKLETKLITVNGPGSISYFYSLLNNGNSIKLEIEFGAPITCSHMDPEPDSQTMTSIEFNDPKKIQRIEDNGLVFLVKSMHNENIQTAKMFCITTGIALFLSLLVDKIIKFICYAWRQIAASKRKKRAKTE
jgi:hypothetical protein